MMKIKRFDVKRPYWLENNYSAIGKSSDYMSSAILLICCRDKVLLEFIVVLTGHIFPYLLGKLILTSLRF